jgi:hypothetical protein
LGDIATGNYGFPRKHNTGVAGLATSDPVVVEVVALLAIVAGGRRPCTGYESFNLLFCLATKR